MAYSVDLNFGNWVVTTGQNGNALFQAIEDGEIAYQKFVNVMYGKTDEQIILLPGFLGRTVTDIIALRYALGAMHDFYLALNNGAVTQKDRKSDLIPFL